MVTGNILNHNLNFRTTGKIVSLPDKSNLNLLKSPQKSLKSPLKDNKENESNTSNKVLSRSPLGKKNQWPDAASIDYKISLCAKAKEGEVVSVKGKNIR